jgi:hypothetical protein
MATEFICKVGPGQDDFSNINAWGAAVGCDISDTTATKVFSGSLTGALANNTAVTGSSSGATGVVVYVNDAGTQIVVDGIGATPFEDAENIVDDGDAGNYWTTTNAGDSVTAVAECGTTGAAESTFTVVDEFTDSSTNGIVVRAQSGHEAELPYNTSLYRFEYPTFQLDLQGNNITVQNIQFSSTGQTNVKLSSGTANGCYYEVSGCVSKGASSGFAYGIQVDANDSYTATVKIHNNCVYDGTGTDSMGIFFGGDLATHYIYNNTISNCDKGLRHGGGTEYCFNNILDTTSASNQDSSFTDSDARNNKNFVAENTASLNLVGTDGDYNKSFTFVAEESDDYHLDSSDTSGAIDGGVGPGSDANVPSPDFDGTTRSGATCDAGLNEVAAVGPEVTATGGTNLPALSLGGAAVRILRASGGVTLPVLTLGGDATRTLLATGNLNLPGLTLGGDATVVPVEGIVYAEDGVNLPAPILGGSATIIRTAQGGINLPTLQLGGSGTKIGEINAQDGITIPVVALGGSATVVGEGPTDDEEILDLLHIILAHVV